MLLRYVSYDAILCQIVHSKKSSSPTVIKMKRIYLSPPHLGGDEREFIMDALDSNWIAPLGPHVDGFEQEICQILKIDNAVALSSGTASLHLALIICGVKPGDYVITSTLTFSAPANAITYCGANPIFVDVSRKSWDLDPELLAYALAKAKDQGKLPKAVIAVDLYGQCADFDAICEICAKYDVLVIEDAAEALGASYKGRMAGSLGALGILSFNGNKIITTSGGGMLVSNNKDWIEKARFLSTQARDAAPYYQHSQIGYNYKLSNLLAAVGRAQLKVLNQRVKQRRANNEFYRREMEDLRGISFMPQCDYGKWNAWLTCILVDSSIAGVTSEEIRVELEHHNIEARPVWKPMHLQPVFASCQYFGGDVAADLFNRGLCLPSGSALSEEDKQRVVSIIRKMVS